jgi:hypothetical protein
MKRTIVILIALIVVVIAIVAWRKNPQVAVNDDGTVNGEYSIEDIIDLDRNLQCDLRKSDSSSNVVGSVVTSGGKARGDFDITTESVDMPFASHFIIDDDTIYSWTSLANVGYKSTVDRNTAPGGVVGVKDKAPLSCREWNADLTRFLLPSGINFQEAEE